jgi:hypothetical protein
MELLGEASLQELPAPQLLGRKSGAGAPSFEIHELAKYA